MSNRRDFLKSMLALSALPLVADGEKSISFLHITDSHMDLAHPQTVAAMEHMRNVINRDFRDIDFVLFGGDNFNNNGQKDEDAQVFKTIIDTLHCPSYTVRGNKESSPKGDNSIDLKAFKKLFFTDDMLIHGKDWMVEKRGYIILGLDSCVENANNGLYTEETLSFAEKILKLGKPTVILNHHTYLNYWHGTNPEDLHKYVLNNTEETKKRLFGFKNLLFTLSGHRHIDNISHIGHVKVVTTRAFISALGEKKYPMRHIKIIGNKIREKLVYT